MTCYSALEWKPTAADLAVQTFLHWEIIYEFELSSYKKTKSPFLLETLYW